MSANNNSLNNMNPTWILFISTIICFVEVHKEVLLCVIRNISPYRITSAIVMSCLEEKQLSTS